MRKPRVGKRLTGVSLPVVGGGVSWADFPDVEREVLQRLLPFLEDRRVLYNPSEVEVPHHCVDSVLRMREFLVQEAGHLPDDSELGAALRIIAGACRGFLDRLPGLYGDEPLGPPMDWGHNTWVFNQALGELRGRVGIYLQGIVERYKLDLQEPLASILPPPPDAGDDGPDNRRRRQVARP